MNRRGIKENRDSLKDIYTIISDTELLWPKTPKAINLMSRDWL